MSETPAPPEFFVARDRARRFALRLEQALEDRKFAYLGAERGMTALTNGAEQALATLREEIDRTIQEVTERRVRDRERGYMEIPLLVLGEGLISRADAILSLDRARARGPAERKKAEPRVIGLLQESLARIHAYTSAYDEKRPAGPRKTTDVAHILERVEEDARDTRGAGAPEGPAFDRAPPLLETDPALLEDLLRAVRRALPFARGPWRIRPAGPGRPLELELGDVGGSPADDLPPAVSRASEVLGFLHPLDVEIHLGAARAPGLLSAAAGPATPVGARVRLPDESAGGVELSVEACAGPGARIPAQADAAVRALLAAPPLPQSGSAPAPRLLALAGLLRAVDDLLEPTLIARTRGSALRQGALMIPRESTRKAGVRKDALDALAARFPEFPTHVVDEVVRRAAEGRLGPRHAQPLECAALLAVFARPWRTGGRDLSPTLRLAPLDTADVESLVEDLCTLAAIRRDLEAGRPVPAERITRLERATLGVLGRLGRLLE